jgi:hypothetical protein
MNEGALLGISSQGLQDRFIGIEPCLRGLLLGMRAEGHEDSQIEAHPRMHFMTDLRSKGKPKQEREVISVVSER